MLQLAAAHPMTFYGVLGQEALALEHADRLAVPVASADAARQIEKFRRRGADWR